MNRRTIQPDAPEHPASVGRTQALSCRLFDSARPFRLESGASLFPVDVEYEAYGTLNNQRSNAILLLHALSGDAHAAGWDPNWEATGRTWRARKPGWWDAMVGPGKPIDTRRFFVLCANVLGGCCGTTGPSSPEPGTGKPYGVRFPSVSVGDWVTLQARLLDHLGIERLFAVAGGSLGGQQALEWALAYPDRVQRVLVLAASARLSAQGLAFNAVGRYSILQDSHFQGGDYYASSEGPASGLAAARMLAHITYLSEEGMHRKFGRRRKSPREGEFGPEKTFEVESYLDYQGRAFVERFDANSYLYITRAMDYYDAAEKWGGGDLVEACRRVRSRMLVLSFSSDWLYPPAQGRELAIALCRAGHPASYVNLSSSGGHDSFLVETEVVGARIRPFLEFPEEVV
jgi:homoserine O-acetyltransferase